MNIISKTLAGMLLAVGLAGTALASAVAGNSPYAVESFGQQADQGSGAYAQAFTTPADTVLEAIQWWGFHGASSGGAGFDNFAVSLGGILQSGTLTSVAVSAADGSYLYDLYTLDVADTVLSASALNIVNDSSDVEWYWQSAAAIGNPGQPSATNVAFRLLGHEVQGVQTVAEPGSLSLALMALVGLGGMRRRLLR